VSYRDSVLYDDFVTNRTQFPLSSLMTHGIIKGKANMLGGEKEVLEDWRDEVVHYYSVGNMMYELYISPDLLSANEMDTLGNVTKWATANAHPLLDNSTMVLGDPAQREPYGYVHSTAEKSIVTLRNPFVRPRTVHLKLDDHNGFRPVQGTQLLEIMYPYREVQSVAVHSGDTLTFDLGAYEQLVFELRPATTTDPSLTGVRYSVQGKTVLAYPSSQAGEMPTLTTAPIRAEGAAGAARTIRSSVTIQVPAGYREARVAFLLEPDREIRGVTAEARDAATPLPLSTENGDRGNWHWFYANLSPGKHSIELTFKVPASPGGVRVSGWLLTRRMLPAHELHPATLPAPSLLPATSDVQRGTYALVEEFIR
jgi:hypothetical protein